MGTEMGAGPSRRAGGS